MTLLKNNTVKTISILNRKSKQSTNQINSIKFINCKPSNNKSNTEVVKNKLKLNSHYITHYKSSKV